MSLNPAWAYMVGSKLHSKTLSKVAILMILEQPSLECSTSKVVVHHFQCMFLDLHHMETKEIQNILNSIFVH